MIEETIIDTLLGAAAVTAVVSTRVYPGAAPQGAVLPLLVVNKITGGPLYADDGEVGLERFRFQIDGYAESYTATKAIELAVRSTLSAMRTQAVPYAELDAVRDLQDGGAGETAYPFRVSMDFMILARS